MIEIILPIAIAICYGISASIQKHSLYSMEKFSVRQMLRHKKWIAALGIGFIGLLVYLATLTFVPLSTVQPFLAISIIVPLFAGVLFFNERLKYKDWACIILILAGIVWLAI